MPQGDRFWWLQRIAGIVAAVLLVTFTVWWLTSLLGLPQRFHLPAYSVIESWGGLPWLLCFSVATSLLPGSISARDRHERRTRAIAGELDAIPLARITAHPEDAPAEADLPISFVERTPTNSRHARIALTVVLFCGAGCMLAFVFLFVALWFVWRGFIDGPVLLAALISLLLTASVVLALYYVVRISSAHAACGARADATGIRQLRRDGEGPLLRWEDARLLELSVDTSGIPYRLYTLYSADTTVRWRDYRLPAGTPTKMSVSRAESDRQLRQFLAFVAARTGLQPRTLVRQLQRTPDPSSRTSNRFGMIVVFAFVIAVGLVLLAVGLVLLAAALVAIVLPLTPNPVLNLYSFATLALSGSAIVAFVLRHWGFAPAPPVHREREPVRREREPVHREREFALPSPLPSLPGASYGFMSGIRPTTRLRLALVGLALAANLVPATVSALGTAKSPALVGLAATVLLLVGIIGVLILGVALLLRPTRVWIDDAGLYERTGRKRRRLRWTAIEEVILHLVDDQPESIEVRGEGDQMAIAWLARGTTWIPARDTTHPVSPEELAAFVVARSGVPLTIKEA